MDIALNNKCDYGAPFTLFIVADVKSFNPTTVVGYMACNHIFASTDFDGFELGFYQNTVFCTVQGRAAVSQPLAMSGLNGNGNNVYTVQCDAQGNVSIWINSYPVMIQQKFVQNYLPQNRKIRLACAFSPNQYPSSNNIDYHQLVQIHGQLDPNYIQYAEAWMASVWGIKSKMNTANPYLVYQFS
jgi:hypothetical protein